MSDAVAPTYGAHPPSQLLSTDWSETVWLDRLSVVVGDDREAGSPLAAALPSMLIALGWPGTGRSLAALLPPPEVPFSLEHLERLLADLGFRTRRIRAAGNAADTVRLRAGSLVQRPDGVAVYLGQPDGRDRWLKGDVYVSFQTAAGDLRDFTIDFARTYELVGRAPAGCTFVAESGLGSKADLDAMAGHGVGCFLVGESLMRQADVAAATRKLLTGA